MKLSDKLTKETKEKYIKFWGNYENLKRFDEDSYVNKSLSDYLKSRNINLSELKILEFGCRDGSSFISFLKNGAE